MTFDIPKRVQRRNRQSNGRTVLIDGDIITYRLGFACEKTQYTVVEPGDEASVTIWNFEGKREMLSMFPNITEDQWDSEVVAEPVENALHSVNILIDDIMEATDCDEYKVFLTGGTNFRNEVAVTTPYKGNRTSRKPVHYQAIRDFLVSRHNATISEQVEADDMLAMEQWSHLVYGPFTTSEELIADLRAEFGKFCDEGKTVIASLDKDLRTVPGWHYNWVKDELDWITEEEGMYNFYHQILTGDAVDNIIGLRGIGPKKATKMLEGCRSEQEMFEVVYCAYLDHFGPDADHRMAENASLLWMMRHPTSEPFEAIDCYPVEVYHHVH